MPTKAELEESVDDLQSKVRDLRKEIRELKASAADPEHVSDSGRTTITVLMAEDGKGTVTIDRDGQRVQRVDFEKEPVQKAGLGD